MSNKPVFPPLILQTNLVFFELIVNLEACHFEYWVKIVFQSKDFFKLKLKIAFDIFITVTDVDTEISNQAHCEGLLYVTAATGLSSEFIFKISTCWGLFGFIFYIYVQKHSYKKEVSTKNLMFTLTFSWVLNVKTKAKTYSPWTVYQTQPIFFILRAVCYYINTKKSTVPILNCPQVYLVKEEKQMLSIAC